MARGALEAMLSVTGQEEFAAAMQRAMGSIKELAVQADAVSKQLAVAGTRMDTAFGTQRVAGIRAMNSELVNTKGHLRQIVSMLGGGGLLTAFGLFEGVKNAAKVQTNSMQWVAEAGMAPGQVAGFQRLAGKQANLGISQINAGDIIRQVQSAYGGRASKAEIQQYFTQSSNLAAISGGRINSKDAASLLIPAIQSDPSLARNPAKAAQVINAMVGAGNMQTQDALAILATPALGTAVGQGVSLEDLAPFYAFGADTRGGPQAQQFARTLATSFINLSKGGAKDSGTKALERLLGVKSKVDVVSEVNRRLREPNGAANLIDFLGGKMSAYKGGGLQSGAAINDIYDIFGGTRGGAGPLAVFGNQALWKQKQADVQRYMDPQYYKRAVQDAQANPQQQGQILAAGFSNLFTNIGMAVLPALTKAVPALTTMFKVMANPLVIRFAETMLLLRGASMVSGSLGALQGRVLAGNAGAGLATYGGKFNPVGTYRGGLSNGMGLNGALVGVGRELETDAAASERGSSRIVGSLTRVRQAIGYGVGGAVGAGAGAAAGYAATSGGGSLLAGGLQGALSGMLIGGLSAGPWGAAAGAVGGAAGAIIGHFNAMGAAAKQNAANVKASLESMQQAMAQGGSEASVIGGDIDSSLDIQSGLLKMGLTKADLIKNMQNPKMIALYRKRANGLKGGQKSGVQNLLDVIGAAPDALNTASRVNGKGDVMGSSMHISDQAVLQWAEMTGTNGFVMPQKGTAAALLPKLSDVNDDLRGQYAKAHNLFRGQGDTYVTFAEGSIVQQQGEDSVEFANRVAKALSKAGARH